MNLGEIGCGGMDWIYLACNGDEWMAVFSTVMNVGSSIKCWEFLEYLRK
jgi:hypothetical protein